MEFLLRDRDYVMDESGGVKALRGGEEVLARVLFRLSARRGAFPLLPEVGSRLYLLRSAKPGAWESLARQYVAEALAEEESLAVTDVRVRTEGERLWVEAELIWDGQTGTARLTV